MARVPQTTVSGALVYTETVDPVSVNGQVAVTSVAGTVQTADDKRVTQGGAPWSQVYGIQAARLTSVKIDAIGAGDVTLVSGVGGKVVRLFKLVLVPAAAIGLTLKSNATALTGALTLATPMVWPFDGESWLETATGEALVLTLGAALIQVSGRAYYTVANP